MQKNGVKFEWTHKCEDGFQRLKEMLTSAPVLKIANLKGNFVVCKNSRKKGVVGVLMHDGHVSSYRSINLKEIEYNYATHHSNLVAIIHALNMWIPLSNG